jgi:adenine-specific DNA methylase
MDGQRESSQDSLRALAATKSGKDSKGDKDKDKSKTKGDTKSAVKCDFCGRNNHSMSACFQFKEAQIIAQAAAAEKGKRSPGMKKGTTMIAKSYKAPDSDDEERLYLANMHIKSHAASVLAARKRTKPKD